MAATLLSNNIVPRLNTPELTLDEKLQGVTGELLLASRTTNNKKCEIICFQVFSGLVIRPEEVEIQLKLEEKQPFRFYEIFSNYLLKNEKRSEEIMNICSFLWGQPIVAPIYTLLLHKWLLSDAKAGGHEHRQKHLNVLITGARKLFWFDLNANTEIFMPLYEFILDNVITLNLEILRDDNYNAILPLTSFSGLKKLINNFMPYYTSTDKIKNLLRNYLNRAGNQEEIEADFFFSCITETLHEIQNKQGLLKYLSTVSAVGNITLEIRTITKLKLQSELYSLTSPGGPRYARREVRHAALSTLDSLFPAGARSRRLIGWIFRLLHPWEMPSSILAFVSRSLKKSHIGIVNIIEKLIRFFIYVWIVLVAFFSSIRIQFL